MKYDSQDYSVCSCTECGERHFVKEVQFVNIEESIEGYDIMTFICPETGNQAKSTVRFTR